MGALVRSGGEIRDHPTSDIGSPDGYSAGTVATVTDTTRQRSGDSCIKCPGTATSTSYRVYPFTAPASGVGAFDRAYVQVTALPTGAAKKIVRLRAGATELVTVRLTSAGKLALYNSAGAQIGSDSEETVAVDRYYRVEVMLRVNTAGNDDVEFRLAPDTVGPPAYAAVTVASSLGAALATAMPSEWHVGWIDAPGVTSDFYQDDVGVNDETGTDENSWLGEGSVVVVVVVDNPVFGDGPTPPEWATCTNAISQSEICAAVRNRPPLGEAHATAHSVSHQVYTESDDVATYGQWGCKPYAAAGVAGDLIYPWQTGNEFGSSFGNAASAEKRAYRFYLNGTLEFIDLYLKKVGAPTDDVVVEIRADDGAGKPSSTVLGTATLSGSSLTTSMAVYRFDPGSLVLDPATPYWFVTGRSGAVDASNYYQSGPAQTPVGLNSDSKQSQWNGSVWSAPTAGPPPASQFFVSTRANKVRCLYPVVCHAEAVAPGTKTGTVEMVTNPVGAVGSFDYGDNAGAANAYPGTWRWGRGAVVYNPTLDVAHTSNVKVKKTEGTTRGALVCFVGVVVEYGPPDYIQIVQENDSVQSGGVMTSSTETLYAEVPGDLFATAEAMLTWKKDEHVAAGWTLDASDADSFDVHKTYADGESPGRVDRHFTIQGQ